MRGPNIITRIAAAAILAACIAGSPAVWAQSQGPIELMVAEIQIIATYVAPGRDPNVEHLFGISPQTAAEAWARARLRAVGRSHRATVIIHEASVVETRLEKAGGISGLFTREPSERYDARLTVSIDIRDNYDKFAGRASTVVTRTRTVIEGTDPDQRQAIWAKMTDAMIADLNREFEKQIRAHLARFIR